MCLISGVIPFSVPEDVVMISMGMCFAALFTGSFQRWQNRFRKKLNRSVLLNLKNRNHEATESAFGAQIPVVYKNGSLFFHAGSLALPVSEVYSYPNKRGMVQFAVPSSGPISMIGIRVGTVGATTTTTIPILTQ